MTKLTGESFTALSRVVEHKKLHAKKDEQIVSEAARLRQEARVDLAKTVLSAIDAGVPISRIAIEGMGYAQSNGIRSFFNFPMKGSVETYLRELIKGTGGLINTEVTASGTLDRSIMLDTGTTKGGNAVWTVERPNGDTFDVWYTKENKLTQLRPKETVLTPEEEELLIQNGMKRSTWWWLDDATKDEYWDKGE